MVIAPLERPVRGGLLTLSLPLLLMPVTASAQEVRGTVVAAETGLPIEMARVSVSVESEDVPDVVGLTDADGTFRLSARKPGSIRIHAEQFGFESWSSEVIEVGPDETVTVEVALEPRAIEIDGVDVRVTSRGHEWGRSQFERRRAENDNARATFLDPVHIALTDARDPIDFFRQVRGIIVDHEDRMVPLIGRCLFVYLDHIRMPVMGVNARLDPMAFGGVDRLGRIVSQRDIRAIEIYPDRWAIPDEMREDYRSQGTGCAIVQVWTTIGW